MKYLITLTPLVPFFFGGENTFGQDVVRQSYFVHSRVLPQASTIIGVLRFVLLKKNGLLITKDEDFDARKAEREKWIGKSHFTIDSPPNNYGKIKSVSPVFVKTSGKYYMPCIMDYGYSVTLSDRFNYCGNDNEKKPLPIVVGKETKKLFPYKDYNNWMYWIDNNGCIVKQEDIFREVEQVGNKVGATGENEQGFFKQTLICFQNKKSVFAFSADIDYDGLDDETEIIQMGGNRSLFIFKAEKISETDEPLMVFQNNPEFLSVDSRIVLMSDAYLSQEQLKKCDYVWGNVIENRYNEVKQKDVWKKSGTLYHLLQRGSVIFCRDATFIKNALKNEELQMVGLNRFIEINKI